MKEIWKKYERNVELIPSQADLLGEPHLANCKESGSDSESEINPEEGNGFWTSERILCINEYLHNKKETIYILCCDNSFREFWHPIPQVVSWSEIEMNRDQLCGRVESVLVLVLVECVRTIKLWGPIKLMELLCPLDQSGTNMHKVSLTFFIQDSVGRKHDLLWNYFLFVDGWMNKLDENWRLNIMGGGVCWTHLFWPQSFPQV